MTEVADYVRLLDAVGSLGVLVFFLLGFIRGDVLSRKVFQEIIEAVVSTMLDEQQRRRNNA